MPLLVCRKTNLLKLLIRPLAVACGSLAMTACQAQITDSQRTSLSGSVQSARQNLNAEQLPSWEVSGQGVIQAAAQVENYFRPITDTANADKWMAYLATKPLTDAIQAGASEEQLLELANRTRNRLIGNIPGLELNPLVELRDKVEQYIAASRFNDSSIAIKYVDQQLISLDQRIAELDAIPTAEQAAALSAITKFIRESNQNSSVPTLLQSVFSRPNVVVAVSTSFIQQASAQVVDRTRAINDCILGTRIVGTGRLTGLVTARTLPSNGTAAVELTMCGSFASKNKGYNGPVTLDTTGNGSVTARRTLYISESGISLSPSMTSATLTSRIQSINHPLKLVRKIASKRAAQQKPQADAIGTAKFRSQVGSEFDQQVESAVASAANNRQQDTLAKGRTTLRRLNLPEPMRTIGSTDHSVFLAATQVADDQLAAINPAPWLTPGSFDFAFQLHESAVDNAASRVLSGRTMTGQQIDRLLSDVGRQPASNVSGNEAATQDETFAIDFARFRPIIFEARDQTLKIGIRGTRFKQGERELIRPLEITATYRPVQTTDGRVYLERVGEVGVDFPGNRRLNITQVALRRSIQRTFDDRFPPTLLDQSVTLPHTLPVVQMRGRELKATSADLRDGWLSVLAR